MPGVPEGNVEGPLFKRSDAIVGSLLAGFAWSAYSYMSAVEVWIADAGVRRGETPDWVVDALLLIAPVTTALVLTGILVRRPWVRVPILLAALGLIVLWILARIELSRFS